MIYPVPYVAMLDVGHGNSTVLRDGGETIIVDCGARGSGLLEFLVKEQITEIGSIFLSHADQDHIGGLLSLMSSLDLKIKKIYVNSDASKGSDLWNDMTYELSQMSERGELEFQVGNTRSKNVHNCGEIKLHVVGPTTFLAAKGAGGLDKHDRKITSNSISATFHITWHDQILAFLAGDIDQIGLDDLVDFGISLKAPVLVFPHHGGKSDEFDIVNFTTQLCKLANAQTVIFSIGRNKYSNPRPEVIAAVRAAIPDVRISCTQLSKHCAKKLPKSLSPHLLELFSYGKETFQCCSGTFIIKLGKEIEYYPRKNDHWKFIYEFAPTSLCS